MKKLGRKWNIAVQVFIAVSVVLLGLFTIWVLGINNQWMNVWTWVEGIFFAVVLLVLIHSTMTRKAFKLFFVIVVCLFLAVMPVVTFSLIATYQIAAQNLNSPREMNYFRNLLGRSYNYTELIEWENAALHWNGSTDMMFYTDPIEIYQYGQARCGGYAILYAELCISQGYECRIVVSIFGDHVWNEVKLDGNWTRVDASPMSEHIGYPLFYEEQWHIPQILDLAFENSSITDVSGTYKSDGFSLFSEFAFTLVLMGAWFAFCIHLVWKKASVFLV